MSSKKTTATFPIVGIGASAGGLEALQQFFSHTKADSGMAYVVVQHLDPHHVSLLTEILQRSTTIPVTEATDQMAVEPDHIYVAPPNRHILIFHRKLQLNLPSKSHDSHLPINVFFRSLAEDLQEHATGIILSGTGSDGTLGLGAIRDKGGITLVQEPLTAKYSGMPLSAIQAGFATQVLPVEKIPEALQSARRSIHLHQQILAHPRRSSYINQILMQLRTITGHDFSLYKKSTIERRIKLRMSQLALEDIGVYARLIEKNNAEAIALFKELLINVSGFFRDKEAFDVLQKEILPELCKDKTEQSFFRVWVPGCASGEEAYSIAILLKEWMEENQREFKAQIFGTDLDEESIATARAGIYPLSISHEVPTQRLRRFFTKIESGYQIKKVIREMVVFATQNILKDPPFTRLDLLSCRNLLIYLGPELQNQLIPAFHYALNPGGVLFLSPSEGIGNHTELFTAINRKWKFYRAINSISTRAMMPKVLSWTKGIPGKTQEEAGIKSKETNLVEFTRRVLIQCFAPASVLTDLKGNILFVHGETGKFLRPAPGQASLNVVEMAREGLELELRTAIRAANEGNLALNRELQVKTNGGYTAVNLSVRLLNNVDTKQNFLLVSFQEMNNPVTSESDHKQTLKNTDLGRIQELERDLAYLKENYQVTLEEQQTSNEELKSANEELQSTNEELQSMNEELETSKEELQSVNGELVTVNSELQGKIEQLVDMQNDMKNLLDNTHIGTLFLDHRLIIRRYTLEATNLYRLAPLDTGRPLSDIKSNLLNDELLVQAQKVLETLIPFEQEVQTHNGSWYLARIQPYRTLDNMIEGVVMTFTDISRLHKAETAVRLARELAECVVDSIDQPLLIIDRDLIVISANHTFYQFFKLTNADTIDRKIYDLNNGQWDIAPLRELLEVILPRDQTFEGWVEYDFPLIGPQKLFLYARLIVSQPNESSLILLMTKDMNDSSITKKAFT